MKKAVVLLSGGLDSTTCLAQAQANGYTCYTLSFDYGQRHRAELKAASIISETMGAAQHQTFQLNAKDLLHGSALTDDKIDVPDFVDDGEIPITYVPARNTVFLAIALGWAEALSAECIVIGASSVDYSGYPDCRPEFMDSFRDLIKVATKAGIEGHVIQLKTPLIYLDKAQTIQMGLALNVDYSLTVSCYQSTEDGKACGRCDSCHYRKKGFLEAGVDDPTRYID